MKLFLTIWFFFSLAYMFASIYLYISLVTRRGKEVPFQKDDLETFELNPTEFPKHFNYSEQQEEQEDNYVE